MFMQTMMQNLGALKVGWHWFLTTLVHAGYGVRKRNQTREK